MSFSLSVDMDRANMSPWQPRFNFTVAAAVAAADLFGVESELDLV
jgi:hypothetical protein